MPQVGSTIALAKATPLGSTNVRPVCVNLHKDVRLSQGKGKGKGEAARTACLLCMSLKYLPNTFAAVNKNICVCVRGEETGVGINYTCSALAQN